MLGRIVTRMTGMAGALCAPLLVGCFATAPELDSDPAQVVIETRLSASSTAPARLAVTLVSSRRDTLRDTITENGSRLSRRVAFLDARAGVRQSVRTEYQLAPNRRWKVNARLLDGNDSLQMSDSLSLGSLNAFERREASLAPAARFAACPARFVLPALRGASTIRFTRLQLLVDGKVARDSLAPLSKAFAAGEANAVLLTEEYLAPGKHALTFVAYGRLEGDEAATEQRLFQGVGEVEAVPGQSVTQAQAQAVSMEWVRQDAGISGEGARSGASPEADDVGLKVTVGKVGTVIVIAQMSGAIDI